MSEMVKAEGEGGRAVGWAGAVSSGGDGAFAWRSSPRTFAAAAFLSALSLSDPPSAPAAAAAFTLLPAQPMALSEH